MNSAALFKTEECGRSTKLPICSHSRQFTLKRRMKRGRKGETERETVGMGKHECNASCIKHPLKTEPFSGEQTMFCGHYLIKFYDIQRTEDLEEFCDSVELQFIK